jgi:Histidine kinase-, DNA gyrase B-, and HSP90-like ATPase
MNATGPILVSIKSNWDTIADEPLVGKDVLELLSSSMYVNALSIYREYVQNSADAIEEAVALGLLSGPAQGRLDIFVDCEARKVRIRDNGIGIKKSEFDRTLVALGASRKRGTKARGFRGVGRLAGLGYCQELIFRSRSDGESEVSELVWDCRRLRGFLRDISFSGSVEDLIRDVVRTRRYVGSGFPEHFFEVELAGIVRHGDDLLVNREAIREYLSQVAPIPFSSQFRFAKKIEEALHAKVALGNVLIFLDGESQPIYRPFSDTLEVRKGVEDRVEDVRKSSEAGCKDNKAESGHDTAEPRSRHLQNAWRLSPTS